MAEIPLTRGLVALVDDADVPLVMGAKWYSHARPRGRGWYAATHGRDPVSGRRAHVYMHRLLLPGATFVDHKNGDGLDNRRSTGNLRACTQSQNHANQAKTRGSSRYKGVSWDIRRQRWAARIFRDGHTRHLGYFIDESAAARAYNATALEQWGEFARLNIIKLAEFMPVSAEP